MFYFSFFKIQITLHFNGNQKNFISLCLTIRNTALILSLKWQTCALLICSFWHETREKAIMAKVKLFHWNQKVETNDLATKHQGPWAFFCLAWALSFRSDKLWPLVAPIWNALKHRHHNTPIIATNPLSCFHPVLISRVTKVHNSRRKAIYLL